MTRKHLSLAVLAALLAVSLAGCGGSDDDEPSQTTSAAATTTTEDHR